MRYGFGRTNNKYGASKVVFKGITFDSRYERDRYIYLCHLQKEKKISGLRLQQGFLHQIFSFIGIVGISAAECKHPSCIPGIQLLFCLSVSLRAKPGQPLLIPILIHLRFHLTT